MLKLPLKNTQTKILTKRFYFYTLIFLESRGGVLQPASGSYFLVPVIINNIFLITSLLTRDDLKLLVES